MTTMPTRLRSWTELSRIPDFYERYNYLRLRGAVGQPTFGSERYINQTFYTSKQWRDIRHEVIARDLGCDLAVEGFEIHDKIIIHHMNPMNVGDIVHGESHILDPEYLISVSHRTHNAIHYGDERLLPRLLAARQPGDTQLWPTRRRTTE